MPKYNPTYYIGRHERGIYYHVSKFAVLKPKTEVSIRNIEYHQYKAGESADLFESFYRFVFIFIFKPVFIRHRENDVRYRYYRDKYKTDMPDKNNTNLAKTPLFPCFLANSRLKYV